MGKWEGHGPFLVCRSWKSPWEGCHVFSWTTPTSLPGMEGLKRKERGACSRDPHQEPPFLELMHLGHPVSSSSLCFPIICPGTGSNHLTSSVSCSHLHWATVPCACGRELTSSSTLLILSRTYLSLLGGQKSDIQVMSSPARPRSPSHPPLRRCWSPDQLIPDLRAAVFSSNPLLHSPPPLVLLIWF